jgi:hypothetical protein
MHVVTRMHLMARVHLVPLVHVVALVFDMDGVLPHFPRRETGMDRVLVRSVPLVLVVTVMAVVFVIHRYVDLAS